jgi:hypothetical protein
MSTVAYKVTTRRNGRKKEQLILVESSGPGNVPRNAAFGLIKKAAVELGKQMEPLSAVAETIRKALIAAHSPTKVEMEFGIELGGESGIPTILVGSSKANFKVTITWENKQPEATKEPKK